MNADLGFSEFTLLLLLALLLFSPRDLGKALAKFKYYKGKFYRMKFDLEDAMLYNFDKDAESAWIVEAVRRFDLYRSAPKVAAFYPLAGEPDICPLLKELAKEGRLLLPRTLENFQMEFVEIHRMEDLVEGRFHVHEPPRYLPAYQGEIPLALVPGVEFSRNGNRHGHGKGYYDRFLAQHPETVKCGVAFSVQVSAKPLECKPHDIPMNYIVASKNDPSKEIPHVEKATV
ncbi:MULTISPECIES: 5-formyltetrahydrofolate cyclo-ligase [Fibrobacter]|uniref:5-formyltetrahydrofolate cyclo-ligase n=1 Tax=Fibrobacter intestinalis TaxID=28122 RepID=A0A1M6UR32_9BACT|nr:MULTISPECIES: 5-formyltetrahydrofolate cyclo-ligase [Fibrobacter]MDD7299540.1 5-formyltetrahydrofolate cyclo-ligase [Fibrobacter intestinalis]PBC67822.1 5,10-methenyltetrahydrofolate synthetase [Fibrobacter sp. UWS1]SHK71702.1 5,10-methenyltetrahydrofolate synthetase [Fibrobacter intestinalis]